MIKRRYTGDQLRVPCGACQAMVTLDWIGAIAQAKCQCGAFVTWYPATHKVSTSQYDKDGLLRSIDYEDRP